jgi:signal transduction histidine kinase
LYYQDPGWGVAWGECGGQASYLPLGRGAPLFAPGQRLRLDGFIQPDQQQVLWDRSRHWVLEDGVLPPAMPTQGRLHDIDAFQARWVEIEGLVDTQTTLAGTHIKLNLLVEDRGLTVYSRIQTPDTPPDLEGSRVRIRGVFSAPRTQATPVPKMDLWTPDIRQAEVVGRLNNDPRFSIPLTPSERFSANPGDKMVRVEGSVKSVEPGKSVTIWDATGQIEILTPQTKRFAIGQRVEAIGYPRKENIICLLETGLVRETPGGEEAGRAAGEKPAKLFLAGQVRELAREEAGRRIPVRLEGVVLWHQSTPPFIFLQDASGGIRVHWSNRANRRALEPGAIVTVEGVTDQGEFCPVVTNAVMRVGETMDLPEARSITLEQAMTGVEEGMWVEMRGCVREVVREGGLRRIIMAGASGEFEAIVPAADWMSTIQGFVARIRGVCTAVCNSRGQLKRIKLWSPLSSALQLEEPEMEDPFQLPLHPLAELRRFNALNSPFRRVRTSGTVLLHTPGRHLYVQDGSDALLVLSRDQEPLHPGDRVELVGFPGNRQGRFLLREANYRRLSAGADPSPDALSNVTKVDEEMESRLVRAEGRLVEVVERTEGLGLFLRHQGALFEALLRGTTPPEESPRLNSRLALTGVYDIQRDEYGNPRSFRLRLRSSRDLLVLERPPWWTAARLLWIVSAVVVACVLAVLWGMTVSRKNRLLEQAQKQLEGANHNLESRVRERTRELREQMLEKEAAHRDLAAAQERLMLASRQAGMAEVATSVLHNVGNVLNSVNISSGLLGEMVRKSKITQLGKLTALLREHEADLPRFLSTDPRGRQVFTYLENLSQHLENERSKVAGELKGLHANLEHINEIVSMQQSYARPGGVVELVKPAELAGDALRMQAVSLKRHRIEVLREFADLPIISVDRHKVLQILNNLIQNAKQSCDARESGGGRVTVRVLAPESETVRIEVEDNGVGIAPENLTRIFSLGFTTRKSGHGFGLHSAALAAKQMGGSLRAESEGPGRGARFVLELPVKSSAADEGAVEGGGERATRPNVTEAV